MFSEFTLSLSGKKKKGRQDHHRALQGDVCAIASNKAKLDPLRIKDL